MWVPANFYLFFCGIYHKIKRLVSTFSGMVSIDSIWKMGEGHRSGHVPREAPDIPDKKYKKYLKKMSPKLSQLLLDGGSEKWYLKHGGSPRECSYPKGLPRDALGIPATRPGSYRIEGVIHQTAQLIILILATFWPILIKRPPVANHMNSRCRILIST